MSIFTTDPSAPCSAVVRDLREVEAIKGNAEGIALQQYGVPAQTALQHLVHEVLEELAVVPARRSPLLVVVGALLVVQLEIGTADFLHACYSSYGEKCPKSLSISRISTVFLLAPIPY